MFYFDLLQNVLYASAASLINQVDYLAEELCR